MTDGSTLTSCFKAGPLLRKLLRTVLTSGGVASSKGAAVVTARGVLLTPGCAALGAGDAKRLPRPSVQPFSVLAPPGSVD